MMKYLSLFSGIEAATCAWSHLGWECVGVSEIDPFPCAVLAHHYPNVPNLGDISLITKEKLNELKTKNGTIDVVVGGSPCQSFSVAGLRKGLEDPRGNLLLEYIRVVDTIRPKYFLWENVPGVLNDKTGAFGIFLQAMVELGYSCGYRVLDAKFFGVPQRRRRVFVVGCIGENLSPLEILFECESSKGDTKTSERSSEECSTKVERSTREHDRVFVTNTRSEIRYMNGDGKIAACLSAERGSNQTNYIAEGVPLMESNQKDATYSDNAMTGYCLTRAMGMGGGHVQMISDSYQISSYTSKGMLSSNPNVGIAKRDCSNTLDTDCQNPARHQGGVTIVDTFTESSYGKHVSSENSGPLRSSGGACGGGSESLISESVFHSNHKSRPPSEHSNCPTLTSSMGSGGGHVPLAIDPKIYSLKCLRTNGHVEGDLCPTLTSGARMGDSFPTTISQEFYHYNQTNGDCSGPQKDASTILARYGTGGGNVPPILEFQEVSTLCARDHKGVATHDLPKGQKLIPYEVSKQVGSTLSRVRRLTPRECERLQGFPDDYTEIPYRKKTKENCPVSPRYKALGNSMAVPVMRWLGERIDLYERKGSCVGHEFKVESDPKKP